ncbi:MAG: hypothetical protein JWM80_740 [Cyanobacteria bacterium RYN_339]|nr:hypothetical protein [Cyanobacteria bacterium RYN_339]
MASRPSSTSASKFGQAVLTALALTAALNAVIGWRASALLQEESIGIYLELERRVEAYPARDRVQVLVFGNSHALAGLRPPQLARSLGLGEDAVFSLAIPSSQPREFLALARRLGGRFPNARLALANLDEALLASNARATPRDLYLSNDDLADRWRLARETVPDLPGQLGTVLTLPFVLAEFAPHLREVALTHPKITLRALATGQHAPLPLSPAEAIATAPWRWGYPPPWQVKGYFKDPASTQRWLRTTDARWRRSRDHTVRLAGSLEDGFADLGTWEATMRRRGLVVAWVQTPIDPALDATMRLVEPAGMAAFAKARTAFLGSRRWLPAPAGFGADDFFDLDHLTPPGAQRLAASVASALGPDWRDARTP